MTNATRSFVAFAAQCGEGSFPPRARAMVVDAITDCIGCMIAGANEPVARKLIRVVGNDAASGSRPLIGTGSFASAHDSALYNGTLAHAIDYDDGTHPAYAHVSASLVPAIMAMTGRAEISGGAAITAYILGIEIVSKLGRTLNTAHYRNGWHPTATFGSLGAAVAASSVLSLDAEPFAMALGMAASGSSGLRANFGTMTKPLHAGYASRNGVLAALMACEGITASVDILENRFGFAEVFNHHQNIAAEHFATWGDPLEILTEFGLALKPYPACGAAHPPIEAAVRLRNRIEGGSEAIRQVRVGVSDMHFEPMVCDRATTPLEGKFCMGYCVAAALLDGDVNLGTFTDAALARINASGLTEKVVMELDDRVAGNTEFGAVVTIETLDGQQLEELVPLAMGKPERWFSKERLVAKFMDCCDMAIDRSLAEEIFALAQGLDDAPSLAPLVEALGRTRAERR